MDSFFARMEPWRRPEGSLHLYALPGEDVLERFASAQAALAGIDHLPLMPEAYLHCTVLRLAQFDDEVTQEQLTRVGDEIGAALAQVPPFDLSFGQPRAGEVAVEVWAETSQGWDDLVTACRRGVREAWGPEARSAPSGPHLSLAYATGPVSDGVVAERLARIEAIGTMRVDTVHLVSVTVRPERGTFDFTSLANWDLTGAQKRS